jgi:hypothetical protein
MTSWLNKLYGWLSAKRPNLTCDADVWRAGTAELNRRTLNGRRESGAFLIGRRRGSACQIEEFVFYDDLDPHALATGIVHFDGNKFTKLWDICRSRGLSVVADVHVHPAAASKALPTRPSPPSRARGTSRSSSRTSPNGRSSRAASVCTSTSATSAGETTPKAAATSSG